MFKRKKQLNWERYVEILKEKSHHFSQHYSNITDRILFNGNNAGMKTFLITSSVNREGKTAFAINMAAILAQRKRKTLLIDANLVNPMVTSFLSRKHSPGLTNIVNNNLPKEEAIIQDRYFPNLYFLPCGTIKSGILEILLSRNLSSFLEEIKSLYEFIIIDSSSVNNYLDPLILGRVVDGILLIILYDRTKKEDILHAKNKIEKNEGKIVGAILNNIPKYVPSFYRNDSSNGKMRYCESFKF